MNQRDLLELRLRANKGDPEAQFHYGSMLITGRYFEGGLFLDQNIDEGLSLVKEAGRKAYRPATEFLASRYKLERSDEPMTDRTLRALRESANKGDPKSQLRYGSMLITGRCFKSGLFVDQKMEEGLRLIKHAAVKEHQPAIDFLASRDKTDPGVAFLKAKMEHLKHGISKGQSQVGLRAFLITVLAGVTTFFLTRFFFGEGFKDATIAGIVTAVLIGVILKLLSGSNEAS